MANPTITILSDEDGKEARKMRDQGLSHRKIGEVFGVNHSTIHRAIARIEAEEARRKVKPSRDWKGSDIRGGVGPDPGRNGNPIILNERHNSLTAAIFGDPSPERWAFIHGSREAAE